MKRWHRALAILVNPYGVDAVHPQAEVGWIDGERFAEFREALAYARGHFSQAAGAHAKLNREEAYWIYITITRGFERQERGERWGEPE